MTSVRHLRGINFVGKRLSKVGLIIFNSFVQTSVLFIFIYFTQNIRLQISLVLTEVQIQRSCERQIWRQIIIQLNYWKLSFLYKIKRREGVKRHLFLSLLKTFWSGQMKKRFIWRWVILTITMFFCSRWMSLSVICISTIGFVWTHIQG